MIIRKSNNTKSDCDIIFNLSNDPIVRVNSFNQDKIEYTNHKTWFEKTISDANTLFLLVFVDESEKEFVGQIRFKRESENDTECIISLSITKPFRGKHISSEFIKLGIDELKKNWSSIKTIIAEVKDENIASNKLFYRENFELISKVNTYKKNIMT